MSKKCLWSDVEMTFVIRCLLDVEFRLWTDIHVHPICLKNDYGLMLKWHLWLDVYWMLNIGCELTFTQFQCLKNGYIWLMFKLGNKIKVFHMLISRCLNNTADELHSLNSTSNRHLITNVILTSDHIHFLDIDIGCMSVQNLISLSNRYLTSNFISPSDHRHFLDINIWI